MSGKSIRLLNNNDLQAYEAYLKGHLSTSMFLLSNVRQSGLLFNGKPYTGEYWGVFEGKQITGILGLAWNGNLLPQAKSEDLAALLEALKANSRRKICGFVGPLEQVHALEHFFNVSPGLLKMNNDEYLYELLLKDLCLPKLLNEPDVSAALAEFKDIEILTDWSKDYAIEALGERDSDELRKSCREEEARSIQACRKWVLRCTGKPVACAGFNARIKEAVQVGGVFTPPKQRSKGYGRAITAACLREAAASGCSLGILFTDQNNLPAQKAYEAVGFRRTGSYRLAILHEALSFDTRS